MSNLVTLLHATALVARFENISASKRKAKTPVRQRTRQYIAPLTPIQTRL